VLQPEGREVELRVERSSEVCRRDSGDASVSDYNHYTYGHANMENPHAERQAALLERIVKNAVSVISPHKD